MTSYEMDKYAAICLSLSKGSTFSLEKKKNDMSRILSIFSTSAAVSEFFSSATIYQDMAVESYELPGKVKFHKDQITQASLHQVFRKVFVVTYPGLPDFPPPEEFADLQIEQLTQLLTVRSHRRIEDERDEWHELDYLATLICHWGARIDPFTHLVKKPFFVQSKRRSDSKEVEQHADYCTLCNKWIDVKHLETARHRNKYNQWMRQMIFQRTG